MGLSDCTVETVIAVSDLEVARRFYENQLGLTGEQEAEAVRYRCAGGTAVFVYESPDNAGHSPATVAGWFVDDLELTIDQLIHRGVVFEQYDQPGIQTDERGIFLGDTQKAAWVRDPDGNTLAITERLT